MPENQLHPHLKPLKGERGSNESDAAVIAGNDWLRLGPGRSLIRLLNQYTEVLQDARGTAPTTSLDTLKRWSSHFDWKARASLYDAEWEHRRNELNELLGAEMRSGMALPERRVQRIKQVLKMVAGLIDEADGVGSDNGKRRIAQGPHPRLNAALLAEERALLSEPATYAAPLAKARPKSQERKAANGT